MDTIPKIYLERAKRLGAGSTAIRKKRFGIWNEYTWGQSLEKVKLFCLGMKSLGLESGDKTSIVGDNDPEWCWGQLGIQSAGGVAVGLFSDVIPSELEYIVEHSDSRFVLATDQEQVDKVLEVKDELPQVSRLIYWDQKGLRDYTDTLLISFDDVLERGRKLDRKDPGYFDRLVAAVKGDDPCLILYTSGTTGLPKGVIYTHQNYIESVKGITNVVELKEGDNVLSVFPAAWAGEQIFGLGTHVGAGVTANYCEEPETMMENLREISPSMVALGPRQWESICATIQVKMKSADRIKKWFFNFFLPVGLKVATCFFDKKPCPSGLKALHAIGGWCVFKQLMDRLGFKNTRVFLTGSAALSPDTFHFLYAIGIKLRQAYAASEFGFAIGHYSNNIRNDTIGAPAHNVKVKIINDEILIGGPTISQGYYKDPDRTKEAFKDGWFHTGDAGHFTKDGQIVYLDRIKDLASLADGTKYAPQYIEGRLRFSPYIKDAIAIGGVKHGFISAIINIDFDMVGKWAEENNIGYTTFADLSQKREVANQVRDAIDKINNSSDEKQKIRKYVLLHKEFDADEGELTRTRKIRRAFVEKRYEHLIGSIYSGDDKIVVEAEVKYRDGRTAVVKTDLKIWPS